MIRDRLVMGIRDKAISEKLQLEADLTLERANVMLRHREAVHEQQQVLKEAMNSSVTITPDASTHRRGNHYK